ncbi:MAG: ATP-dependent DNA helicase [Desulfuromonadales bacterium GWD2_61_12]|nr:MAG: ATP-dependent DNA helicase [Desulfuromonadales bacterium GWC2_61_20]OGR34540.1 MAG: ATP-dependent DNA helicase [Desulfuromonadales bacterium GWD2_61_12]HAD03482.1 ATP-dependent DNA helicase [Desulfuromonas sp.]HBT82102.1 ATP-dependent DNA helicase [Desulfuromonas sp.]
MSLECQNRDKKSLRTVTGKTADFPELAKDCVAFANAQGGSLLIGIEDKEVLPPAGQKIKPELLDTIRKRITELTVNVVALPSIIPAENGGEYIDLLVKRSQSVASTSDGRYFLRVGDRSQPIVGDDVLRLADERPGRPWETMDSRVPRSDADAAKLAAFVTSIRNSDRVKASVKEKSPDELLSHYGLAEGTTLTHLGVLLLGTASQRRNLGTAPLVQAIKYDEMGQKINKWLWDDYALSPIELVDAVWREVPDFRESYEVAEGLFRRQVPAFDEKVIRELLVNALVHRPYTQRGDIFLNLTPDRLAIVNPGRLPLGVTPQNILHASRRRNDGLATVFHDIGLMEKEGSGYDMLYDRLLSSGRPAPVPEEGPDSVKVTIRRRILKPEVIKLVTEADARYQMTQRERITLGALAQHEGLTARELATILEVNSTEELVPWFGRLLTLELVQSTGRTQATRYFVDPGLLRNSGIKLPTTLKRIEPHRLKELVREDLRRYPRSKIGDISERIGAEVNRSQLKRALAELAKGGEVLMTGERNKARYSMMPE